MFNFGDGHIVGMVAAEVERVLNGLLTSSIKPCYDGACAQSWMERGLTCSALQGMLARPPNYDYLCNLSRC